MTVWVVATGVLLIALLWERRSHGRTVDALVAAARGERRQIAADHAQDRRVWETERTQLLNRIDPSTMQVAPSRAMSLRMPQAIALDDDKGWYEAQDAIAQATSDPALAALAADALTNGIGEPA